MTMKSLSLPCGLALGCIASLLSPPTAPAQSANPPLPEELIVRRSQPSVFQVLALGAGKVAYPENVTVKRALLEREYAARTGNSQSMTEFSWSRIDADPAAYLEASQEMGSLTFETSVYATGSAFAVSREGILLTNAHVLADPDTTPWKTSAAVLDLLGEPVDRFFADLVQQAGGVPVPADVERTRRSLLSWYLTKISVIGKFKEARIALKYGRDETTYEEVTLGKKTLGGDPLGQQPSAPKLYVEKLPPSQDGGHRRAAHVFAKPPEPAPVTRPLRVLAMGTPFPGEDVAVLQIVMDEQDQIPAAVRGLGPDTAETLRQLHQTDRLICLPLGDSDFVLPGAPIHALGFPGRAFEADLMDPSAELRVSSRPGEIGQTKRMSGGWDAFEMNAEIDHGDSGGPVIDKAGNVIAINVAGVPLDTESKLSMPGHKFAVPINVAKKYLKKAGVTPDRGPLGQSWDESLRLYDLRKYDDAATALWFIQLTQEGIHINPLISVSGQIPIHLGSTFTSPYVDEMIDLCRKAQRLPK